MRTRLTPEERRENARLASAGAAPMASGPRSPQSSRGWLWGYPAVPNYRRRKKAADQAALGTREVMLDRLEWQVAELRESLDKVAGFNAIIGEVLGAPLPLIW
jgi:hypothetical protein